MAVETMSSLGTAHSIPPGGKVQAPLDERIVATAIDWLVRLRCEDTPAAQQACQRWRAQHPDHELAWQRLCSLDHTLGEQREQVHGMAATRAIDTVIRNTQRRRFIKKGGVALTGLLILGAWQRRPLEAQWHAWRADETTATGQQRRIALPDGTQILLNTSTTLNIRYNEKMRLLVLEHGEIQIETAADAMGRPFAVETSQGRITPIGTRFTVRQAPDARQTVVQVLAGAVDIFPGNSDKPTRVQAGQGSHFDRYSAAEPAALPTTSAAWVDGILAADNMRLEDFITELGRYRKGWLRCHPDVADLRITGTFPLADTDRILASLPRTLAVEINRKSSYWVTVSPRQG